MATIKLTDAAVQKLKAPSGGRAEYFDATLPGFGLRIAGPTPRTPEGRKSWILMYRHGGAQKRLTLEPTYPALGLAAARRRAGEALTLLSEGKDPGAQKAAVKAEAAKAPDTIASVFEEFMKRHMTGKRRAKGYIDGTRGNFDNHVLPRWGRRHIKSITRRDVIEMLDAIVDEGSDVIGPDGKKRHLAGGPIAANRVLAAVRLLFNWALKRGIIDSTPAALVERPGEETSRERTLTADEARAVWTAASSMGAPVGDFFRVAMLTGQRRDEVATMRWEDLDLDEKLWTIPKESTKAGKAHIVPLAPFVVELLKAMPRKSAPAPRGGVQPSPWVFTVGGVRPISGHSKAKARIDAKIAAAMPENADALPGWTIHDLRRSTATGMGRLGVSRLIIGKVLNHSDRSVTGVYDRFQYLDEKRHALNVWAQYVDGLVNPRAAADNVLPLEKIAPR